MLPSSQKEYSMEALQYPSPSRHVAIVNDHLLPPNTLHRRLLIALLLASISHAAAQQQYSHHRLWPPPNIEPCAFQCPMEHVQVTGNKTSVAEMSFWGPLPVPDFMSNSRWQSPDSSPPMTTVLSVKSGGKSGFTTLVVSRKALPDPKSTQPGPGLSATFVSTAWSVGRCRTLIVPALMPVLQMFI